MNEIMDIHTALICVGVFFLSAIIVYLISVLGIKERTFEEAIAEQKRRSQEEIVHSKSEKPKKEKKFKKWTRQKKEKGNEKYPEEDDSIIKKYLSHEHVEFKPEPEIIAESDDESKPPKTKRKKPNVSKSILAKKEACVDSTLHERVPSMDITKENHESNDTDKDIVSDYKPVVSEPVFVKEEEAVIQEEIKTKVEVKIVEIEAPVKEITSQSSVNSNTPVPKKKKVKQDLLESGDSLAISGSKMLNLIKSAILTDEDVQMMIDFLLNKQKDVSGWTKKNDPVNSLKKQLQEKEQALEVEQKQTQAATNKLRELRKELNQEKAKLTAMEQASHDKVNQLQQEIQALQAKMKSSHDQHLSDMSALQNKSQQLQTKMTESSVSVTKLQEEKCILEDKISELETENEQNDLEITRLQEELEELQYFKDQSEAKLTNIESMQQTNESLKNDKGELEKQLKEIKSSHEKEYGNLKKQFSETCCQLKSVEGTYSAVNQELKDKKSSCAEVESENNTLRQKLQTMEGVVKDREQELKKLQASLENACAQRTELESRLEQLQSKLEELTSNKQEKIHHLITVQVENENLSQYPNVEERTSAEGEESPHYHQNGDLHPETDRKIAQKKVLELSEHERIVGEKEEALERLWSEVNEQKSIASKLSEELELQKRKNNELREKNWEAMEAVSSAEKTAEKKIEQLKKEYDEKLTKCQQESEKRIEEIKNKKAEERSGQELKKLDDALKKANQRLKEQEQFSEERLNQTRKELQKRLQDMQITIDNREKEISQNNKDYGIKIKTEQKREQELLQRIFPDINIDKQQEHSVWISQFEHEALNRLVVMKSGATKIAKDNCDTELNEMYNELVSTRDERDKLDSQIQHYKTVLSETEAILNKLQSSVEAEEMVWKERLQSKEQELQKVIKDNEELMLQMRTLQINLQHLQGVEEMQAKLKELQAKLQGEEAGKKILEQKFDEANKSALKVQEQLDAKLKEIEELKKDKNCLEDVRKELQQIKTQLERERKITKDLSAQTVKLNSLVKIGQDALSAEQKMVRELQVQLQDLKDVSGKM